MSLAVALCGTSLLFVASILVVGRHLAVLTVVHWYYIML